MPAYDFRCPDCNTTHEKNIKLAEYDGLKDKQVCPECGAKLVRMVDCSAQFALKGDGWADMGYGITSMEQDANQQESYRMEDFAFNDMAKQPKE